MNKLKKKKLWQTSLFVILLLMIYYCIDRQVNYSKLEFFLANKQWKKADKETTLIVQKILNQTIDEQHFFGYSIFDILGWLKVRLLSGNLSCQKLQNLDQLWLDYSDHRFGLSVQAEIINSLSSLSCEPKSDCEKLFYRKVGWIDNNEKKVSLINLDKNNNFYDRANQKNVPRGYLPTEKWIFDNKTAPISEFKMLKSYSDCIFLNKI